MMAGILSAFNRGKQEQDPMRESAALTTVYLLEQNQKFEQFMRQKVDELEARVAAQQARLSTREEAEEREIWAALESFEEPDDEAMAKITPVDEGHITTGAALEAGDDLFDREETSPVSNAGQTIEPAIEDGPEAIPDYLALMSGTADVTEANAPVEDEMAPTIPSIATVEATDPTTATGDDDAITVPEDGFDMTDAEEWSPDLATDDQVSAEPPPLEEVTEFPSEEMEPWSGQYETFQIDFPDVEAVDDIGSELGLADEVELLAEQPTISDEHSSLPNVEAQGSSRRDDQIVGEIPETEAELETANQKTNNEQSLETTGATGSETAHHANDEADEVWEASLPAGKKDDWS
jgi:hypothetical protein